MTMSSVTKKSLLSLKVKPVGNSILFVIMSCSLTIILSLQAKVAFGIANDAKKKTITNIFLNRSIVFPTVFLV